MNGSSRRKALESPRRQLAAPAGSHQALSTKALIGRFIGHGEGGGRRSLPSATCVWSTASLAAVLPSPPPPAALPPSTLLHGPHRPEAVSMPVSSHGVRVASRRACHPRRDPSAQAISHLCSGSISAYRPPQPGRQPQGIIAKDITELMPSMQPNGEGAHRNSVHEYRRRSGGRFLTLAISASHPRVLSTSGEAGLSPKQRNR